MPSCATALNSSFDCEYVVSAVSSRTRLAADLEERGGALGLHGRRSGVRSGTVTSNVLSRLSASLSP